jgi:hypothetical protein
MATPRRRRYSTAEFLRGAAISRLEPQSIELARQVLVDGRRQADVARAAGTTRQWVSELTKKMQVYIEQANPVPEGWQTDTVTLPARDWPKVRAMEAAARRELTVEDTASKSGKRQR